MGGARDEAVGRFLQLAERSISLLSRVSPKNFRDECESLLTAWQSGQPRPPRFVYEAVPPLPHELISALKTLTESTEEENPWRRWHQARARELLLEARMAETVGTLAFAELAQQRFGVEDAALEAAALALAEQWVATLPEDMKTKEPQHATDDLGNQESLGSLLLAKIGKLKLPFRVVFSRELASLAAVGERVVAVRARVKLTKKAAERIVVHEIDGHALPRHRAEHLGIPLFTFGTAHGFEDQEGRALWLESKHGFLDAERRHRLGARHLAVKALRNGADWVEAAQKLAEFGLEPREMVEVACRVFRGGGWGREEVYVPAYLRVEAGLAARPELETWMCEGKISLEVARELAEQGGFGLGAR